jgi:hypothetical protein
VLKQKQTNTVPSNAEANKNQHNKKPYTEATQTSTTKSNADANTDQHNIKSHAEENTK